jgi:GNAT superfamily N-acetyltransferase
MAVFRGELTFTPAQVVGRRTHVVEEAGAIVGFYTLLPRAEGEGELEHLFVDPGSLRRGVGAALFRHACALAVELGWPRLVIQSDPNAAGFYQAMGARLERHIPSSIPGRTIPFFGFDLTSAPVR